MCTQHTNEVMAPWQLYDRPPVTAGTRSWHHDGPCQIRPINDTDQRRAEKEEEEE